MRKHPTVSHCRTRPANHLGPDQDKADAHGRTGDPDPEISPTSDEVIRCVERDRDVKEPVEDILAERSVGSAEIGHRNKDAANGHEDTSHQPGSIGRKKSDRSENQHQGDTSPDQPGEIRRAGADTPKRRPRDGPLPPPWSVNCGRRVGSVRHEHYVLRRAVRTASTEPEALHEGQANETFIRETDEFSYNITKDPVHIRHFHATVLQLQAFTAEYRGRRAGQTGFRTGSARRRE